MWWEKYVVQRFSSIPWIKRRLRKRELNKVLFDLDKITKDFTRPTVKFSDSVGELYDSLKGVEAPPKRPFRDYLGVTLNLHTKTSNEACKLLEDLQEDWGPHYETHFKENPSEFSGLFLNWYSNAETVELFYSRMLFLLNLYKHTRTDVRITPEYEQKVYSHRLEIFITTRHFKLLLIDFIEVMRFLFQLELWGYYEER